MAFFYLYKKKKKQLPHIFSKMFSSSVDRKQFHLHENLTPPSTLLPQHHLLLLLLLLSHFHSSSTSPGDWDTTLGSVSLHSIFLHQERSSEPTGMRGEANNRQADINDRLVHVLQDLSLGFELESTVTQWFTSAVTCALPTSELQRLFATPRTKRD